MIHKPHRWLYSLNGLEYPDLWTGVAFMAPFLQMSSAGKVTLLDARGGPLNGANLTANGTQWRGTPYGLALGNSNNAEHRRLVQSGFAPITTSDGSPAGDVTILILANPRTAAAAIGFSVHKESPFGHARIEFNKNTSDVYESGSLAFSTWHTGWPIGNTSIVTGAGAVDGGWHLFGGVRRSGVMAVWSDGRLLASSSLTTRNAFQPGGDFCIGGVAWLTDAGLHADDTIAFVAAWNRALSEAEMRLLGRDPFCMFRSRRDWIMKAAAAGGADVRSHIIPAYMRIAA